VEPTGGGETIRSPHAYHPGGEVRVALDGAHGREVFSMDRTLRASGFEYDVGGRRRFEPQVPRDSRSSRKGFNRCCAVTRKGECGRSRPPRDAGAFV